MSAPPFLERQCTLKSAGDGRHITNFFVSKMNAGAQSLSCTSSSLRVGTTRPCASWPGRLPELRREGVPEVPWPLLMLHEALIHQPDAPRRTVITMCEFCDTRFVPLTHFHTMLRIECVTSMSRAHVITVPPLACSVITQRDTCVIMCVIHRMPIALVSQVTHNIAWPRLIPRIAPIQLPLGATACFL